MNEIECKIFEKLKEKYGVEKKIELPFYSGVIEVDGTEYKYGVSDYIKTTEGGVANYLVTKIKILGK